MISKEQLIEQLHIIFGSGGKNSMIEEILEKSNGYRSAYMKAYKYLKESRDGQAHCKSDDSYWIYAGDITLAKVMCATLIYLNRGNTKFPSLGYREDICLMDKQAILEEWASQLVANHKHKWKWEVKDNCAFEECKLCYEHKYNWEPPKWLN